MTLPLEAFIQISGKGKMRNKVELIQAKSERDWVFAAECLAQAVARLERQNMPLWTSKQVSLAQLKQDYAGDQLYLLRKDKKNVGSVFINADHDPFWQDRCTKGSLFFHKLVLSDACIEKNLGLAALTAIKNWGYRHDYTWLRCDCHGARPRLREFYERFGFINVDRSEMYGFDVARYQLKIND